MGKQYSGETQFQAQSTTMQVQHCLRNFDLSAYRRVLSDIAVWIYQGITKVMEEEIQPVLVIALLEHEGIGGLTNDKPRPQRGSLNNLLLRKELCHWSRGMQIRYNIAQLEQWARDQKVHDDRSPIIDALSPIVQASQLLQARKSDEDVQKICDMCDELKVSQLIKILNLYTPADEFEERVSPSFVRKIQNKLQDRAMEEAKNQVTLLLDTKFSFAVRFPFNPSNINLAELEIPDLYNNLPTLVRKV